MSSPSERPPLAAITELLSRRWMMRIIWELRGQPLTFRALQQACSDISPSVLADRLKRLEAALLIEKEQPGYALSPLGRELLELYGPLGAWARRWAAMLDATRDQHDSPP